MITITFPGVPVPEKRTSRKQGLGPMANHRRFVAEIAAGAMDREPPMLGPLCVSYDFVLEIPISWPNKKRLDAVQGRLAPATKPDLKNLIASVEDGCNGIVWRDDAQVVKMKDVEKRYGLTPRTTLTVTKLED